MSGVVAVSDDGEFPHRLLDRFRRNFAKDTSFRVEDILELEGERALPFLLDLIRLEIQLRQRAGQRMDRFEFLDRFPNLELEIETIFDSAVAFPLDSTGVGGQDEGSGVGPNFSEEITQFPVTLGPFRIQEKVGEGAFGIVYRATDLRTGATRALKFPRRRVLESVEALDQFMDEAAAAELLDHPGIVKTYGVEEIDGVILIVQQFIDGQSLESLVRSENSCRYVADLMARIADAVAYAHQQGYIHRDLKPSNILIDQEGNPYIADFGLAIHVSFQRFLKGQRCGAAGYMSPELVRGLSHQLDCRSDIWSLGVIFYQLLAKSRPFNGDTREEIFEEIKNLDVRPLRMLRPEIDPELQRICLRCLKKRKADRFATADELAADLREWLGSPVAEPDLPPIVPKGLNSFGEEDSDFFLRLLPGPKDRHGFPEIVRFWKSRIETQSGFAVGVIFGPSGCGKSSFVKAALLPNLNQRRVETVYVEATSERTERRLIDRLHERFEDTRDLNSLPEILCAISRCQELTYGKKVVIILDQFEQWLHAADENSDSGLIEGLRHCDGQNLSCIAMVRDDFWSDISGFVNELDVELREGVNCRRLDRFSLKHAREVLIEFGKAYECLPNDSAEIGREQQAFLEQAVEQLAVGGRVVGVRLAILAEMFRNRPWTRLELKKVGGASGIGECFLRETFDSRDSSPRYRAHRRAAHLVLETLLPPVGLDIRGHMCSRESLLEASGYQGRPAQFESLVQILTDELRLLTPISPDQAQDSNARSDSDLAEPQRFFQLTHDFLVPSIRNWLTRKKKESWRGRAELRLDDLVDQSRRQSDRVVRPNAVELVSITLGVPRARRSSEAQKLVGRGLRYFGGLAAGLTVLLVAALSVTLMAQWNQARRVDLERLLSVSADELPAQLDRLRRYGPSINSELQDLLHSTNDHYQLRAAYALAELNSEVDDDVIQKVVAAIDGSDVSDFDNLLSALRRHPESAKTQIAIGYRNARSHQENVRLALADMYLGDRSRLELLTTNQEYPDEAMWFLEHFPAWNGDHSTYLSHLKETQEPTSRFYMILALGCLPRSDFSKVEMEDLAVTLKDYFDDQADSGIRSAARWSMTKLGVRFEETDPTPKPQPGFNWWVRDVAGVNMEFVWVPRTTFVRLENYNPEMTVPNFGIEPVTVDGFWISVAETSFEHIHNWQKREGVEFSSSQTKSGLSGDPRLPAYGLNLSESAEFCNWLTTLEGLVLNGQDLMGCYVADADGLYSLQTRAGFRLATPDEWGAACRAGARSKHFWGSRESLAKLFGHFRDEANGDYGTPKLPMTKMPNRLGLFDICGNCWELSHDQGPDFRRSYCRGGSIVSDEQYAKLGDVVEMSDGQNPLSWQGLRLVFDDGRSHNPSSVISLSRPERDLSATPATE